MPSGRGARGEGKSVSRADAVLFIDARHIHRQIDRAHRELTDDDIARIANTYHAWRGEKEAGEYADIAGFCKSVPLEATVSPPAVGAMPPTRGGQPPIDIKSLQNERQPASANEMAAVVAFYLSELASETERKSEVQTEDMVKYFKQAGFPLPKQPQMLMTNAKNAGYFDSGGTGRYKLNAVGYNLVAHNLPRAIGEAATPKRPRKPRATGRKPKTNKAKRA